MRDVKNAPSTGASSYQDPYPGRKGADRITEACGACGGTGIYSAPSRITFYTSSVGDVTTGCFACGGAGTRSFLVSSARSTARRRARLADEARDALARIVSAQARFMEENASAHGALTHAYGELREGEALGRRAGDLLDAAETAGIEELDFDVWGLEAEAVIAELRKREAAKRPVPTGRVRLEGEITATKWVENAYGGSLKMLVTGPGWKVWGSVPRGLEFDGRPARGHRVAFTATVERGDDDESFGFFSRPAKPQLLAHPVEASAADAE